MNENPLVSIIIVNYNGQKLLEKCLTSLMDIEFNSYEIILVDNNSIDGSIDFITKNFSEVRWARNMALVNMSLMDAGIVCWDTKNFYFNPRPTQLDPRIKTLTGIPNFPAYISGHSTFSAAAATILGHIIPEKANEYEAMAKEASLSRMYGGIHFRSDCEVGLVVGENVGNYAIQRALTDGAE